MRDAVRLRRWLAAAAFATGCGGAGRGIPAGGRADAGVVNDNRSGVMRTPPENCLRGQWCGPVERVKRFAAGVELRLGCPVEVSDNDGTSFKLRDEDTARVRGEGEKTTCCYDFEARCWDDRTIEGRPYVQDGVALMAPGERGGGRWFDDARAEHASIASFARHTLELLALGAPAELVAGAVRAGLDEVAHAQSALRIASRLAGRPLTLGPLPALPPRRLDVHALAESVLIEGCWNESVAALAARRELRTTLDPEIRAHLRRVSRDEARHAALAWRTLRWAVEQGARLPELPDPELSGVRADAWHGIVVPLYRTVMTRSSSSGSSRRPAFSSSTSSPRTT